MRTFVQSGVTDKYSCVKMATAIHTGRSIPTPKMAFVNTETRIGDEVIVPGLARDLEAYYDKTDSAADKAKTLELLTSLRLGQEVRNSYEQQRPVTAHPAYGRGQPYVMNPYQTTYNKDYPIKDSPSVTAYRPMTSQGFTASHDLSGPMGDTTYTDEYPKKPNRPSSPIRSGTASGSRSNKPHPLQSFLIWRFPARGKTEQKSSPWSEEVTDDMINQVHKRLCQSTYQSDYLGIPQGFQVKEAYNLPPDWKSNIPYTLDSVARYSYQKPNQQNELQLPTTRYGSNRNKQLAASGTIPTASTRYFHIKQRTSYDRHYNDNAEAVVSQIRDVGRKLGTEALKKYYEKAVGEEKELIGKILGVYNGGTVPSPPLRPPSRMSERSEVPPVSTPSSFASRKFVKTPSTGKMDKWSKPPVYPFNVEKHVGVNKPRGHYPTMPRKGSTTPDATPVTNFNNVSPSPRKDSKTPSTPVSAFEFTVPPHAPIPPDTPQSLPLSISPGNIQC